MVVSLLFCGLFCRFSRKMLTNEKETYIMIQRALVGARDDNINTGGENNANI